MQNLSGLGVAAHSTLACWRAGDQDAAQGWIRLISEIYGFNHAQRVLRMVLRTPDSAAQDAFLSYKIAESLHKARADYRRRLGGIDTGLGVA